jgi:hypothetical protein
MPAVEAAAAVVLLVLTMDARMATNRSVRNPRP